MSYVKDKAESIGKKVLDPFNILDRPLDMLTGKDIKKDKAVADQAARENIARQTEAYDAILGRLQPQEALTASSLQDYLNYINDPSLQNQTLYNTPEYQNYVNESRLLDTRGANNDLNTARSNLNRANSNLDKSVSDLSNLAGSPEAQAALLKNNPVFNEIIKLQQENVLKNQAASGKLGSGDTLLELQRQALPAGLQFVDSQVDKYRYLVDANRGAVEANRGIIDTNKNIVDSGVNNAQNVMNNGRNIISDREAQLSGVLNFNQGMQNSIDQYQLNKVGATNSFTTDMADRKITANQARNAQVQGLIAKAATAAMGVPPVIPTNISPQARNYGAANQSGSLGGILSFLSKV